MHYFPNSVAHFQPQRAARPLYVRVRGEIDTIAAGRITSGPPSSSAAECVAELAPSSTKGSSRNNRCCRPQKAGGFRGALLDKPAVAPWVKQYLFLDNP